MLALDQLTCLDLYLWQGQESVVADSLGISQSSVSRKISKTLELFDLTIERSQAEHELSGTGELLQAEREVHQLARFKGFAPLRFDAAYSCGPWFASVLPTNWISGPFSILGVERPLSLLRDRVVDAWIGAYQPDLPGPDDPEFCVVDLLRETVFLLASPTHPLAGEGCLSAGDLERFPSMALPTGMLPKTEERLRRQGLWNEPMRTSRYDPASWEGACEDGVTMTFGHCLTEVLQPGTVRLDWDLGHISGDALVVRRDLFNQAEIQRLLAELKSHARVMASAFDAVDLA